MNQRKEKRTILLISTKEGDSVTSLIKKKNKDAIV